MKYVYAVYCRFNGKPAGFQGMFTTKERARKHASKQKLGTQIKRERVDLDYYETIKHNQDN